jgi:hypothetical protein
MKYQIKAQTNLILKKEKVKVKEEKPVKILLKSDLFMLIDFNYFLKKIIRIIVLFCQLNC